MQYTDILIMWAFALFYTLYKTNSIQTSITTTSIVLTVGVVGVLHRLGFLFTGLAVLMMMLTVLVWRVIPHDKADTWSKADV